MKFSIGRCNFEILLIEYFNRVLTHLKINFASVVNIFEHNELIDSFKLIIKTVNTFNN